MNYLANYLKKQADFYELKPYLTPRGEFDNEKLFRDTYGKDADKVLANVNLMRAAYGYPSLKFPKSTVQDSPYARPYYTSGNIYLVPKKGGKYKYNVYEEAFHEGMHHADDISGYASRNGKSPDIDKKKLGSWRGAGAEGSTVPSYISYESAEAVPPIVAAKRMFYMHKGREAKDLNELIDYVNSYYVPSSTGSNAPKNENFWELKKYYEPVLIRLQNYIDEEERVHKAVQELEQNKNLTPQQREEYMMLKQQYPDANYDEFKNRLKKVFDYFSQKPSLNTLTYSQG